MTTSLLYTFAEFLGTNAFRKHFIESLNKFLSEEKLACFKPYLDEDYPLSFELDNLGRVIFDISEVKSSINYDCSGVAFGLPKQYNHAYFCKEATALIESQCLAVEQKTAAEWLQLLKWKNTAHMIGLENVEKLKNYRDKVLVILRTENELTNSVFDFLRKYRSNSKITDKHLEFYFHQLEKTEHQIAHDKITGFNMINIELPDGDEGHVLLEYRFNETFCNEVLWRCVMSNPYDIIDINFEEVKSKIEASTHPDTIYDSLIFAH